MNRSAIFALLLVLLLVTFIAAETSAPASSPTKPAEAEIIVKTEKRQETTVNNNINTDAKSSAATSVEPNKQQAAEVTVTVEDGKQQEKATTDAPKKEVPKQADAAVADETLVWLERPFSLLNAINEQLERNSMFRRNLWEDDLEDAFDNDVYDNNFFGGHSLLDSVFGRRRVPSLFDSLRRRPSNNLYRRPAFYLNRLLRDNSEQDHNVEHTKDCGCAKKQQQAKKEAAANNVAPAQKSAEEVAPALPVLKRVKTEWNEDKDNYNIKIHIPEGVYTKDQIKIQVKPYLNDKEMIVISGENKDKQSSFEKSFVFQKSIDSNKVKAKFENGLLNIEVSITSNV